MKGTAPSGAGTPQDNGSVVTAASRERPTGCLLWGHTSEGADAGALAALAQELAHIRGEPVEILLTGDSTSGAERNGQTIPVSPPTEADATINSFLDHWTPDLVLAFGVPDRPKLIRAAHARQIPLFLAASERGAFANYRRMNTKTKETFELFDAILAPSAADSQTLRSAGIAAEKITITGPLSDTALALPVEQRDLDDYAASLAARPVWLAARVTLSEVRAMEAAQRRTIRAAHRLLLIIVPRDAADGLTIAEEFIGKGWRVAVQSRNEIPNETIQVFIADAGDDLGLWIRLAPITVLGGSFDADAPVTDPFEIAALGSAIVHGPETENSPRFDRLKKAGATMQVARAEDLGECLFRLLSPENTAKLAHAGWSVTSESAHVVEKLARMIDEALDAREAV